MPPRLMCHSRRKLASRGFTLLEALLASAILAIAALAIVQAMAAGHQQTADALVQDRAISLAEALMEEMLSLPYGDPQGELTVGPDAGETGRLLFDNLDDYNGFTQDADEQSSLAGAPYPIVFQAFSRSVSITNASLDIAAFGGSQPGLEIVVTVTQPSTGRSWTLTRFVPEPAS